MKRVKYYILHNDSVVFLWRVNIDGIVDISSDNPNDFTKSFCSKKTLENQCRLITLCEARSLFPKAFLKESKQITAPSSITKETSN